jgi:hypothetical protein
MSAIIVHDLRVRGCVLQERHFGDPTYGKLLRNHVVKLRDTDSGGPVRFTQQEIPLSAT